MARPRFYIQLKKAPAVVLFWNLSLEQGPQSGIGWIIDQRRQKNLVRQARIFHLPVVFIGIKAQAKQGIPVSVKMTPSRCSNARDI